MGDKQKEIERYLIAVKQSLNAGNFSLSSRSKNQELIFDYVCSEERYKEILSSLTVEDFSQVVHNDHPKFKEELLYIFGKDVILLPRFGGSEEVVSLYIKLNKLANQYVIAVSFHKQEFPLTYQFKS